jgi:hypothetical protein
MASADMYYSEVGTRDVFLSTDERGNFQIWAQIVGEDDSTAINLCEIFLEYAMYCCIWWNQDEALHLMQDFAGQIGRSISKCLKENACLLKWDNPIDRVLEHLFGTINAHVTIDHSGAMEHFIVLDSPLEIAAEHSGLRNIELAHHGLNVMCQNMIQAFDPDVVLKASPKIHPEFDFTILKPEFG